MTTPRSLTAMAAACLTLLLSAMQCDLNQPEGIVRFEATPDEGEAPLTVEFDYELNFVNAAAPSYTCLILFGDGDDLDCSDAVLVNAQHTYETPGEYTARLEVNDGDIADEAEATITVTDGSGDGGDGSHGTALITSLAATPGPPAVLPYPYAIFDVSIPIGAEPPGFLVAVMDGNDVLRGYDDGLSLKDDIFIGQDLRFAVAPVSYQFMVADETRRSDGLILGGADGAIRVSKTDTGPFNTTQVLEPEGNVIDAVSFDGGQSAALVNFTEGEVNFYTPNGSAFEMDTVNSGLIGNEALGGDFVVSVHIPEDGFDDVGDKLLALTTGGPETSTGKLHECERTETSGVPGASCRHLVDVGDNALKLRCVPPDGAGETACAATAFDDQAVTIFAWAADSDSDVPGEVLTVLHLMENAQTVTPAVARSGDDVIVVATDADENQLVAARVDGDGGVTEDRAPTPELPVAGGGGERSTAATPAHVVAEDRRNGSAKYAVGSEASEKPDMASLMLGILLALGINLY